MLFLYLFFNTFSIYYFQCLTCLVFLFVPCYYLACQVTVLKFFKFVVFFFDCHFADELDKTLAEYDIKHMNNTSIGNDKIVSHAIIHDSIASKKSVNLANDANAASIRTRYALKIILPAIFGLLNTYIRLFK
jgi:hypothetical protein